MRNFINAKWLSLNFFFVVFIFCCGNSASAEVWGGLEFEIPSMLRDWQFAKYSMGGEEIKEYSHDCDGFSENFIITYTKGMGFKTDYSKIPGLQSMVEKAVKQSFPTQEVIVTILNIEPKSLFYKTVLVKGQSDMAYSWTREFLTKEGGVSFRYVIAQDLKNTPPLKIDTKNADHFVRFLKCIYL
jgi:hypothetical protein